MSFKRIFVAVAGCLLASGALVAQEFAIPGKDFESGAADAKLAEIARQAAASGKSIVVTTPPYWQARAASKIRAAAPGVQVKTSDAFFENVLIRVVDGDKTAKPELAAKPAEAKSELAAKPAEAKPKAAEPAMQPKPTEVTEAVKPAARGEAKIADASATAKPQVVPAESIKPAASHHTPPPVETRPVDATPAVQVATIAPAHHPGMAEKPKSTGAEIATTQRAFENQLNLGAPATGTLRPMQLRKGDEIFVHGPVRAVVRRDRARSQLFWIDGDLQIDRVEIVKTGTDRYRVDEPLRDVANPSLRAMHTEPRILATIIPAGRVRVDMEKHFNDAKAITAKLRAEDLRYGDLFYVYRNHAVIFRRNDLNFDRYWLDGDIDLNQAGVVKEGDAYRIVSERL
ncbi:MAG: hypothetical protein JSR65_03245 [Proteobacteria bacterium]|nr:hypothetical protein [Pseudomonadota bacterium]